MDNLKIRLSEYIRERQGDFSYWLSDFDKEEIKNFLGVLDELNDDLTNMKKWDEVLLLRLIDDDELYAEVDALYDDENFDDEIDEFGF